MDIKLDEEALATIAATAIFKEIDEDTRNTVIQQAVKYLLTPVKTSNYYSTPTTPLQDAFNSAIRQAAHKAVEERVKNDPEVEKTIKELLGPIVLGVVEGQSRNYRDGLANAIGTAIGQWLADNAREAD